MQNYAPWFKVDIRHLRSRKKGWKTWRASGVEEDKDDVIDARNKLTNCIKVAKSRRTVFTFRSHLYHRIKKALFHCLNKLVGIYPVTVLFAKQPDACGKCFVEKVQSIQTAFATNRTKTHGLTFRNHQSSNCQTLCHLHRRKCLGKSCSLDVVSNFIMKEFTCELLCAITAIIKSSLLTYCILSSLKISIVTLIMKKPFEPGELSNYRLLSNLPFLSKLLVKRCIKTPAWW